MQKSGRVEMEDGKANSGHRVGEDDLRWYVRWSGRGENKTGSRLGTILQLQL